MLLDSMVIKSTVSLYGNLAV